ncbi:sulfotransferase family protein [Actibacterium sp. D379-3]
MFKRLKTKSRTPLRPAAVPDGPLIRAAAQPREFDQYLFICGLHRSGTTLLEQMLSALYDVAVLRADAVPENEGQFLQDVYPRAGLHGGPGRFAFDRAMYPAPPPPDKAAALKQRLMCCWTPWIDGEGRSFVEKSPPNITKIGWLRAVFPGARFIIISRDPRAVAAATQKWSGLSISEMVLHWNAAYTAALDAAGDDCLFVTYESLCDDPMRVLNRLGAALSLPQREKALVLPGRFADIRNSNADYIAGMENNRYGRGVWDELGYVLD